jgi:hypothetical protein
MLAKPWHNPHPLPALHSFALATPAHIQARGVLLFLSRLLLLHSVWHLFICMRGDVFYVSNPTSLCQWIMPQGTWFPHERHENHSPEVAWLKCLPPPQTTSKWRSNQLPHVTMPPLQQFRDIHPICWWKVQSCTF